VDPNDDVRAAASTQLVGYLERANSALLREELLIGLIRGWYATNSLISLSLSLSLSLLTHTHTQTYMYMYVCS
jgi:hypothetical protein